MIIFTALPKGIHEAAFFVFHFCVLEWTTQWLPVGFGATDLVCIETLTVLPILAFVLSKQMSVQLKKKKSPLFLKCLALTYICHFSSSLFSRYIWYLFTSVPELIFNLCFVNSWKPWAFSEKYFYIYTVLQTICGIIQSC